MMRDSCVRARRSHSGLITVLAALASLGPLSLLLAGMMSRTDLVWRSLLVQASMLAGITQGAVLVAAVLRLWGLSRFLPVRRAAEGIGLLLPIALLAHAVIALASTRLAIPAATHASQHVHLSVAAAFNALGICLIAASLSPGVGSAMDRGEVDGHLAQWLSALWPHGGRRARPLAFAYLMSYMIASPYLAHASFAPLGSARSPWLRGPFVALSDASVGLTVALLAAWFARSGEPFVMPLRETEANRVMRVVGIVVGTLGLVLAMQLCALAWPSAGFSEAGLLPTLVSWPGWILLAIVALALAHAAPVALAFVPNTQPLRTTLTAFAATLALGTWIERAAIAMPLSSPGFHVADAFTSIAFIAAIALLVVLTSGVMAIDDDAAMSGAANDSTLAQ